MAARTDHTAKGRQSSKMPELAQARSASQKQQEQDAIPIWEWIVAGVGFVLVAGMIGFLIYEAFTGKRLPPDVKLSVDSVDVNRNGY
jgi:hypothetical protein